MIQGFINFLETAVSKASRGFLIKRLRKRISQK